MDAEEAIQGRNDEDALDVSRFKSGNEDAFGDLVRRRQREVFLLCRRMIGNQDDAMEAVQETFLRAYRSLNRFRGEASFRTWVLGIAANVCRNKLSSAWTRFMRSALPFSSSAEDDEPRAPDPVSANPDPESAALGTELRGALENALARISPEHREIIVLRQIQDLDYEEMAEVLGSPVGTVKSRLCRARKALREAMEDVWP